MKRKEAALILLAASMLSSGCGDKAVSAPVPAPTKVAAEAKETEKTTNADRGNSQATKTEATEAVEKQERIIITGGKIEETDILKTLNPAEGIRKNKPTDKYVYSYLDTFIASLQTYKYFDNCNDNQTADIADYYADTWLDMTAEELDTFLKELSNQTGTGINSPNGTDLLDAIKFGDKMTDKTLDNIEEDLEDENNNNEENTTPTKPTKPTTPSNQQPAEPDTPPEDNGGSNSDAGYMTDEEFDAQDWSSDPNINMDFGDTSWNHDPNDNGTIIAY